MRRAGTRDENSRSNSLKSRVHGLPLRRRRRWSRTASWRAAVRRSGEGVSRQVRQRSRGAAAGLPGLFRSAGRGPLALHQHVDRIGTSVDEVDARQSVWRLTNHRWKRLRWPIHATRCSGASSRSFDAWTVREIACLLTKLSISATIVYLCQLPRRYLPLPEALPKTPLLQRRPSACSCSSSSNSCSKGCTLRGPPHCRPALGVNRESL